MSTEDNKIKMKQPINPVYGVRITNAKSVFEPKEWYICCSKDDADELARFLNQLLRATTPFLEKEQLYVVDQVPADVIHEICYGFNPYKEAQRVNRLRIMLGI